MRDQPTAAGVEDREVRRPADAPGSSPTGWPPRGGPGQALRLHQPDVGPGRWAGLPGAARGAPAIAARHRSPDLPRRPRGGWEGTARGAERTPTGPTPGPPPVRDAEGLVQVEVADVGAEPTGLGKSDQSVEVGTVDVDLPAGIVDEGADLSPTAFLEDPVGRRVGDHQGGEDLSRVLGRSWHAGRRRSTSPVLVARDDDDSDAQPSPLTRRVRAVGAARDQADDALIVTASPGPGERPGSPATR